MCVCDGGQNGGVLASVLRLFILCDISTAGDCQQSGAHYLQVSTQTLPAKRVLLNMWCQTCANLALVKHCWEFVAFLVIFY